MNIDFKVDAQVIRHLAKLSGRRELSTEEADAFLWVFNDEVRESLAHGLRECINRHFQDKPTRKMDTFGPK